MGLFNDKNFKVNPKSVIAAKTKKRNSGVTLNTTSKTVRLPNELIHEIENVANDRFDKNKQGLASSPNSSEAIIYLIKKGLEAERKDKQ
tara:strand:+ start:5338 stop:5604 length:267 start_codon:yes stop_codon:yes gene_type:complete